VRVKKFSQFTSQLLPSSGEKALLPVRPLAVDVEPAEAHEDWAVLERIRADEVRAVAVEAAMHRRIELRRSAAVQPPDRPASAGRIVRAHGQAAIDSAGQIQDVVVDRAQSPHGEPQRTLAGEFLPFVGTGKTLLQAAMPHVPAADQPLPVARMRVDRVGGAQQRGQAQGRGAAGDTKCCDEVASGEEGHRRAAHAGFSIV
jgi:hypothetical protein